MAGEMNCAVIGCDASATMLVTSDGMNDDGVMILLMWSGWERVGTPADALRCEAHTREFLARLPSLAPQPETPDSDGEVFTHG